MRQLVLLIALGLSTLPLVAGSQENREVRGIYIALGDSVAAGVGSSLPRERSYPSLVREYMEESLDGQVILENIAEPGATTRSLLAHGQFQQFLELQEEAENSGVEILAVTITVGGNEVLEQAGTSDTDREASIADFSDALRELAAQVASRTDDTIPVTITTIYDPTGTPDTVPSTDGWWIAQFNQVIRDVATANGLTVADIARELGTDAEMLTRYPTDVHPTNAGHEVISRIIWDSLGFDESPPRIEVVSDDQSNRLTPTFRFTVSEPVVVERLSVSAGDNARAHPAVQVSENEFIALIERTNPVAGPVRLRIEAEDMAGNVAALDHTITFEANPLP